MLQRLCVPLPVILVVFMSPILSDENAFSGTCPTPSPIKPRDLNCLNNTVYHIVRDPRSGGYIERCFILNRILQGYATVMDKSNNLNYEACQEGTFQRQSYKSNTQCACNETKGHCNETGQVVASNGSTTEDRTCRCDFRRGYKFSTKPSNECFCQSSSEDCTCIKEECETGYRLSPDYECVHENLYSTTDYTCKDYITSDDSITESVPGSDTSVSEESTTESVPDNDTSIPERKPTGKLQGYIIAIIAICSVLAVIIVIVVVCALICCKKSRPGRNGSATRNNGGKLYTAVQVTDADIEMSEHVEVDELAPDEVTNTQQPETTHSHLILGAFIFGKKKMIKIISCICAPMRICCIKDRPGRNGSAATDNEGTSKGKDSDAVQETGSGRANEKLIKVDKLENEDTVLDYTVE